MVKSNLFVFVLALVSFTMKAQEPIVNVEPVASLNSVYDEMMPVFSPDGLTMYFVRGYHPENTGGEKAGQDIWVSTYSESDSSWSTPKKLSGVLNNEKDNSVCGVVEDGEKLYLDNIYDKKGRMHPGLSFSTQNAEGQWSTPQEVKIKNFKPKPPFLEFSFPEAFPNVIIISQENEDTTYKEDLYVSFKGDNEEWKEPIHLGDVINSKGYEISPFLAKDGKTLYFATNGRKGFGGCDIYKSTRLDDSWTNWSEPENLGDKINSDDFEAYFTVAPNGLEYFVRGDKNTGDDNIMRVVYTYPAPEPEPVKDTVVPVDTTPAVIVQKDTVEKKTPAPKVAFVKNYMVYFGYDKAQLDAKALAVLNNVMKDLNADKSRKIQVVGHTCDKGGSVYNMKLSKRRTNSVLKYLEGKGVSQSRVLSDSKGLSEPKEENNSEENRAKNRRAEIKIYE